MSPGEVACFLTGVVVGALLVGAAASIRLWRSAWSRGEVISGEALERARKRGES